MTVFKIFKVGLLLFDIAFLTGPFTQISLTLMLVLKLVNTPACKLIPLFLILCNNSVRMVNGEFL